MITELIKQRIIDAGNPDTFEVIRIEYDELENSLPPIARHMRNDGTENIIFPLFSNTAVYPTS